MWGPSLGIWMSNCLAFDQSYTNFGYAVYDLANEELIDYGSFKTEKYSSRVVKRHFVWALAKSLKMKYNPSKVVCEQIRLKNKFGISLNTIVALAEITSRIADAVWPEKVYTVDSKSWKAKVCKDASADKADSVAFVKKEFDIDVDHDTADAICMAIYPSKEKPILNLYES